MKLKNIALTMALTLCSAASFAKMVTVHAALAVGTCTGANANCPVKATTNAIGDPFNVDPSKVDVNKLGTITTAKSGVLDLPTKADEAKVFSFTPTEGALAGETVYFAFKRHAKIGAGKLFAGQEAIEVFRQDLNDPQGLWLRAGRFFSEDFGSSPQLETTLKPNGDLVATFASAHGKAAETATWSLGLRNL